MKSNPIFEYPLNEKMRNYLRVEALYLLLVESSHMDSQSQLHSFFRALFDLNEVLERSEWRIDLLKDLTRQQEKLELWAQMPGVDTSKIQQFLETIYQQQASLSKKNKMGQPIQDDKFLACLRQRFSLPGGSCSFDLPQLLHWQCQDEKKRQQDIQNWLNPYQSIANAISLLLQLMREQAQTTLERAENGFHQGISEDCEMLQIELTNTNVGFPTISGHKNRFALRFMDLDGAVTTPIEFKLSCCKSL